MTTTAVLEAQQQGREGSKTMKEDEEQNSSGVSDESPRPAQARGFSEWAPFTAMRIAPGEYEIRNKGATVHFFVEGAAFAEWIARALTEYDKCLDAIEVHLDDCFGCELDDFKWNEEEGNNDRIDCANCSALEDLVLVRHNAEVEIARLIQRTSAVSGDNDVAEEE